MDIDRKVSVGNLLTIGTIVVGGVMAWASMGHGLETNARDISQVSARVTRLETNLETLINTLNADRVSQTRLLTELQTDVRYIKENLR